MTDTFRLAKRLDGVSESATLKLNAAVQALKASGVDVVNLTAGEPDFNVPEAAKQAVLDAVAANRSKYTPAAGIPELRQAIADKTNRQQPELPEKWKPADVVVTNGGKHAIFNALLAMLDPGDQVLVPSPYWLSYPEMARIAGAAAHFIETPRASGVSGLGPDARSPKQDDKAFKIGPAELKAAIEAAGRKGRVRLLVLNSPSNPTGAVYSREEFRALGKVLLETPGAESIWVLSDEIYDRLMYGQPFCSFLSAVPELRHRTVTVNGMSKSAAMTGWRVGWSVAPAALTQGMITLQGQSTSNVNALAQWASVAALKLPESDFVSQVESFRKRRDLCLEILGKARKIEVFTPGGAFYLFVGVGRCLRPGEDSMGFAERVLEGAKVAVVPGTPFGAPQHLRLSFASDERSLREGCERLARFLE